MFIYQYIININYIKYIKYIKHKYLQYLVFCKVQCTFYYTCGHFRCQSMFINLVWEEWLLYAQYLFKMVQFFYNSRSFFLIIHVINTCSNYKHVHPFLQQNRSKHESICFRHSDNRRRTAFDKDININGVWV